MSRDIADKVFWGWVDHKEQIHILPFYMIEPIKIKEKEVTTRGIFEPFAASCIEEAMEMAVVKYGIIKEQEQDERDSYFKRFT